MELHMDMDRRTLLERIVLLAGVTVLPAGCKGLEDGPGGSEFALSQDQSRTLSAIADTVIPKGDTVGALDAGVPQKLEGMLRDWASDDTREAFVGVIGKIDEAAQEANGKGFAELDGTERLKLLNEIDKAALKTVERPADDESNPVFSGPAYADPGYARLRELIVLLFYYSEPALTQELDYVHNPGRWDPSVPVTPETRQSGGMGRF